VRLEAALAGSDRTTGLTDGHEHLAGGAELEDLVSLGGAGGGSGLRRRTTSRSGPGGAGRWCRAAGWCCAPRRTRRVVLAIGHPDVAVTVDVHAVRKDQQAAAECGHHLAGLVELHHRRDVLDLSRRRVKAAVAAAALGDPDRLAVLV